MKRTLSLSIAMLMSSNLLALENQKSLGPTDKYYVSQDQAETMLKTLQSLAFSPRPPLSDIAYFNGGTAKQEPNDPLPSCYADEMQYEEMQISLINKWRSSWKEKNLSAFNDLLKNKKIKSDFAISLGDNQKISEHISLYKWQGAKKGSFKDYLSQFKKIEDIDLVTMKVGSPRSSRDKKLNMVDAELQVYFDIRGIDKSGNRRNDRGPLGVTVTKSGAEWKITGISDWGVETLIGKKPAFEEVTASTGVNKIPQYRRLEAIRRGGYALAVGDYNNDGINDMYVGAHGAGKLLKGHKDGTYSEVKDSGLNNETLVKTAVFADFDNDSHPDLLLVRFSGLTRVEAEKLRSDVILYHNNGKGVFTRKGEILGESVRNETAMPAAVGDFNGDGLLDFYIGYPGNKDFTVFSSVEKKNGTKEQGVYINQGNFTFLTKDRFVDYNNIKYDKVADNNKIYPHSSMALDFDQDGDTDIMVIDDRGNISPAYRNDGKGGFTQAGQHIGVQNQGFGMGMAAADVNNDGILDMVMTNVNFTQKFRFDKSCWANWDEGRFGERDHGLKFYKGMQKGQYAEATGLQGLNYAGEGLAGVEFLDYNNDGFQDLYVANGLWSGTDKDEDLSNLFIRTFQSQEEMVLRNHRGEKPQSEIMDILSGYKGSIVGKKNANSRLHLAGFQRNRLFKNNGDGSFTEVGYLEGVDSIADGYIMAKSDINNDGKIDFVLRNGDPGTKEVSFEPVQVFKNNSEGNSVRLKLIGSRSNTDAIGSEVTLKTKMTTQLQQLVANNGTAQSELVLHFGLGAAKEAEEIRVRWPNGNTSVLKNIKPGFMKVYQNDSERTISKR